MYVNSYKSSNKILKKITKVSLFKIVYFLFFLVIFFYLDPCYLFLDDNLHGKFYYLLIIHVTFSVCLKLYLLIGLFLFFLFNLLIIYNKHLIINRLLLIIKMLFIIIIWNSFSIYFTGLIWGNSSWGIFLLLEKNVFYLIKNIIISISILFLLKINIYYLYKDYYLKYYFFIYWLVFIFYLFAFINLDITNQLHQVGKTISLYNLIMGENYFYLLYLSIILVHFLILFILYFLI